MRSWSACERERFPLLVCQKHQRFVELLTEGSESDLRKVCSPASASSDACAPAPKRCAASGDVSDILLLIERMWFPFRANRNNVEKRQEKEYKNQSAEILVTPSQVRFVSTCCCLIPVKIFKWQPAGHQLISERHPNVSCIRLMDRRCTDPFLRR